MRRHSVIIAGLSMVVLLLSGPTAAHAESVTCVSPVTVSPTSEIEMSGGNNATVVRFDFVGHLEHCLADGSRVQGTLTGSVVQVVGADGTGHIVVRETLSIPDGSTLGFIVRARFTASSFEGSVITTAGTGTLKHVAGEGSFFPTAPPTGPIGPTAFLSSVVFDYR